MIVFAILSAIILASALGVVIFRNPVYAALCLVANLLTVAAVFAALQAHFLAIAQIIVYAGAIMVLFIFVIMLLNVKTESHAGIFGIGFAAALSAGFAWIVVQACRAGQFEPWAQGQDGAPDAAIGTVKAVGLQLYSRFLFPFEAASLLIIAAVLGAVMLARKNKEATK